MVLTNGSKMRSLEGRRQSRPAVLDADDDRLRCPLRSPVPCRPRCGPSPLRQHVEGVEQQIVDDLAELDPGSASTGGTSLAHVEADLHVLQLSPRRDPRQTFPKQLADRDRFLVRPGRSGEIEESADDLLEPEDFTLEDLQIARAEAGRTARVRGGLHKKLDRRKRVADLVSDARGHLADPGELFGSQGVAFGLLQALQDRLRRSR